MSKALKAAGHRMRGRAPQDGHWREPGLRAERRSFFSVGTLTLLWERSGCRPPASQPFSASSVSIWRLSSALSGVTRLG
jgi:hypothetical protein